MSSPQKVVIPKGLVKPNETTIIEIPGNLKNVGTVVARPRPRAYEPSPGGSSVSSGASSPRTPKLVKKRSYSRKTWPPKRAPQPFKGLPDEITYGGIPHDDSSSFMKEWDVRTPKPWYPKSPGDRYQTKLSEGDFTYFYPKDDKGAFDPPIEGSSTFRWWNDPIDPRPHIPFYPYESPVPASSPLERHVPPRFRPPVSPLGSPESLTEPESYYKYELTSSSPDEIQKEVTEESSYYDYEYPDDFSTSSGYQRYRDQVDAQPSSDLSGLANLTPDSSDMMQGYLGSLESCEASRLAEDLSHFQTSRRKLIMDASSLEGPGEIVANFMRHSV